MVVDVRSRADYKQAHLPESLHIPLEEVSERAGELDGNKTIVLYVLSSSESGAQQAAMALYALGFAKIAVLEGGIQRWYADGYVIEGSWLTPTPDEVGPPWTLTPLGTGTEEPTVAVAGTDAVTATPTLGTGTRPPGTPTPTLTVAVTPTPKEP
jgi:rhodanese-related sulfurtransferase